MIVPSASLQGTAAANKLLAFSQKETIWPTLRVNLHLQVLTGRQPAANTCPAQPLLFSSRPGKM